MSDASAACVEIRFPGNARFLPAIRDLIREMLEAEDEKPLIEDIPKILLAVQEACVNAIDHGHRGDVTRPVELTVASHPDRVEIRIRDRGEGFLLPEDLRLAANPTAETGRGLAIMQAVMDEVSVANDGTTTVLSLIKRKGNR